MLIVFESQQEEAEGKYQESIHKMCLLYPASDCPLINWHFLLGKREKREGCWAYFLDKTALLVNMFVNPWCRVRFSCEIARQMF